MVELARPLLLTDWNTGAAPTNILGRLPPLKAEMIVTGKKSVRDMIRRGVPQKTAPQISGHKTDSVFSRYNIVSEGDMVDAARKIEEGAEAALSGIIHSSFTVAPNQGHLEVAPRAVKPS